MKWPEPSRRARQRKGHGLVVELGFQHQANVLAPDRNRAAVHAAGLVVKAAEFGEIPRFSRLSADGAIARAGFALLQPQINGKGIARGRKQVGDGTDGGDGVGLRHVERRAVRENTGSVHQADGSVAQGIAIEGGADEAIALEP